MGVGVWRVWGVGLKRRLKSYPASPHPEILHELFPNVIYIIAKKRTDAVVQYNKHPLSITVSKRNLVITHEATHYDHEIYIYLYIYVFIKNVLFVH